MYQYITPKKKIQGRSAGFGVFLEKLIISLEMSRPRGYTLVEMIDNEGILRLSSRFRSIESTVRDLERDLRYLLDAISLPSRDSGCDEGGYLVIGPDGSLSEVCDAACRIFNCTRENLIGRNFGEFISPHMQTQAENSLSRGISGEEVRINFAHPDGYEIPLILTVLNGEKTDGTALCVRDNSLRRELEDALEASRENYQILAETASDAIIQIGMDFSILFANSAVETVFGYKPEELKGRPVRMLFPESRYGKYSEQFKKYFIIDERHRQSSGLQNTIEVLGRKRDGELVPMEISFGNSRGVGSDRILTCIIRDIALRKKAERRLKYLAYHDKLTSLGNRDRMNEALDQLITEIRRDPDRNAAVLFLDLDGFKKVNDSLGHEMGDMILKECARRLSNCTRAEDQVYRVEMEDIFRLGGDEFTVLLPRIRRPEDAALVSRRIIDTILEPFTLTGYGQISDVSIGVSIGIALIPQDGRDKTTILRNADAAMYNAKELGNTYVFFTEDMNNKAMERLMIEEGLRRAISSKDFELHYQPIVDRKGSIRGLEALIRWMRPDQAAVFPDRFIGVAEDTRLILPIGRWVLETACRHIKQWKEMGLDIFVSINVSPVQLDNADLATTVRTILKRHGITGESLILELTETPLMNNPETSLGKMNQIIEENEGIRLAVDDFGTGYSSLGYLSRFPVKILKIDRSFVNSLDAEGSNLKIIRSILSLGKSLDLDIVAEGVETEYQLRMLAKHGCDAFQGYHFSKALPFEEVTEYIRAHRRLR